MRIRYFSDCFVNAVDYTYENIIDRELTGEGFGTKISVAFDEWLGKRKEARFSFYVW